MTNERKLAILSAWIEQCKQHQASIESFSSALGLVPEGPLLTAMFNIESAYTGAVAELVGDTQQWLEWFAFETEFGEKTMEASPSKDLTPRPIRNANDLMWLLQVQ